MIVIIRTPKGEKFAKAIAKHIIDQNIDTRIITRKEATNFLKDKNPKETIIHTRTASPDLVYKTLKEIENKGFKILNNPETIKTTSDKILSNIIAQNKGIKIAKTIKISKENLTPLYNFLKENKSIIIKPQKSQGQGIYCFKIDQNTTKEEITNIINKVPGKIFQAQETIAYESLNRVIVIGKKAIKEAVTYDTPNEWKCSVCLNPNIKHRKNPDNELIKLAEDTAEKLNANISFIDFFKTYDNKYILNEINTACNLLYHEKITGYPISKDIANLLIKEYKELKSC